MKKLVVSMVVLGTVLFANTAEDLVNQNGCLECHAVASKKNAPAFAGIGKRNKMFNGDNAKASIIASIKNGSTGKYPRFSSTAMPAFANLSDDELNIIADWILAQSSKAKGQGGGMGGGGMGGGQGQGRGMGMR